MFGDLLNKVYSPVPTSNEDAELKEEPTGLQAAVSGHAATMKDRLNAFTGKLTGSPAEPAPEPSWYQQATAEASEELDGLCALSWKQRMIGFAICGAIGMLISFGSFLRFAKALGGNPVPFAKTYSLGNIISLCATSFLVGPCKQLKSITEGNRLACSIAYIGAIVATLFVCLTKHYIPMKTVLILVLVVVQFVAWAHYCCSYIPYGRQMLSSGLSTAGSYVTG
eukprot:TRINITY_DN33021_c0_g1_i1.p1 TRINITY_DN33021_c0_g1~~TRINITY_DN33021_c0_g1_i1.p1  ORF type:complete len:224 (+),score=44.20 TRINITY_DN33021_c0_g1_i1:366-1037(+)